MNAALILQMITTLRELHNLLHWLLMVMFVSGQKLNSGSSVEVCYEVFLFHVPTGYHLHFML